MIHVIIGTKAQLIKMAPIMVRLKKREVPYNFIFTGQHRATIEDLLEEFGIKPPDVVLYDGPDITSMGQMFFWFWRILSKSVFRAKEVFGNDKQGIVLVHGDTLSTLLGAIMGRLNGLRVGHVESGLRSFNLFHPFPEEITRLITFRLSHTLYCPGEWAMKNVATLKRDIIDTKANTMIDTLALPVEAGRSRAHIPQHPFVLVSLHRFENIFNKKTLLTIIKHLEHIAHSYRLLFILHPPTEKQLRRFALYERLLANSRIELRPRYNHSDFVSLLKSAEFVICDGGSLQEETSYLGIPCLLMRKTTERQEGIGANVVLADYNRAIIDEFIREYQKYRCTQQSNHISPSDMVIESALQYR
ncbi:UDP-N-acetylglucosamine 2-epimerase [Thiovibrio sp. JS02]